jgi:membrane protein YqaA with SNARE-associated domain
MKLFGPLYDRVLSWSRHPYAERYLAAMSFAESSFFPIPPDVMLAPMCLAEPARAWRYAAITTVMSVLGGIAGYAIGFLLFESIEPWLRTTHYWDAYVQSREWFDTYGVWVVFVAGFSPIPYKIFTIAAGVAALSPVPFLVASMVGRGTRFFLVAGLIRAGGPRMEQGLRLHVERLGWSAVVIVGLGIAWLTLRH